MDTCLCRIERRCLQQTHSVRRCLNRHQVMCILLITKSPLGMFEQSDIIQYKLLRSVSPIDFASDLMVTCLFLLRRKGFSLVWAKGHSTLSLFDIAFSMTKDIGNPPSLHAMPHRRTPLRNGERGKTMCSAIPYFCCRDGATLILATVWFARNYKIACGLAAKKSTEIHA